MKELYVFYIPPGSSQSIKMKKMARDGTLILGKEYENVSNLTTVYVTLIDENKMYRQIHKDYMIPKSEWDALQREKKLDDLGI